METTTEIGNSKDTNRKLLGKGIISIDAAYGVNEQEALKCADEISKRAARSVEVFGMALVKRKAK